MAERDLLHLLKSQWLAKIKQAQDFKREHFQDFADEAMRFFRGGTYDFLYNLKRTSSGWTYTGNLPKPSISMSVNRASELEQLFGPVLYTRNPVRKVNPRVVPMVGPEVFGDVSDPRIGMMWQQMAMGTEQARSLDAARAGLVQHYLNYTPYALDLKTEARFAITEALIKGAGCLWQEVYRPPGGQIKFVGSFYDSADHLVIDPDAEMLRDAYWIARRRIEPVWKVEDKFGYYRGALKGNLESLNMQGVQEAYEERGQGDLDRKRGLTSDLLCYWEVFSKMGIGERLKGVGREYESLEELGDHVYLAVSDGVEWPLNLPPAVLADQEAAWRALQWQTPFWMDDGWPMVLLSFHSIPGNPWPQSHLRPAMGELHFLNWAYSFVASKIRLACRDFIAIRESAEEIRQAIEDGKDYTFLKIRASHGETIDQIVRFLQHPPFQSDIWTVIQAVEQNFERRTGLSEIIYGTQSRGWRSATEAEVKEGRARIRPDDMAAKTEETMTAAARQEALAARWHLERQDLVPVMGEAGAWWWEQIVSPTDPAQLLHQLEYRIEAGSMKKPNKEKEIDDANSALQFLAAPLFQLATATGQVNPFNALLAMWGQAQEIDPSPFFIQPPPPPAPPEAEGVATNGRMTGAPV